MIKKIFLLFCFIFIFQPFVFADEIIDAKGNIIPCKIETVEAGFVEYRKNESLYTFTREKDSMIFNDYVDVEEKFLKKESIKRYYGKVILKDFWSVVIQNKNGKIDIPFFKIKFIGIYKP